MIQSKQDYLLVLKKKLKTVVKSDEIIQEFDQHITEILDELTALNETEAMEKVIERVGTAEQVAALYQQELDVTPNKIQWAFISINLLFFVGGICLTVVYHFIPIPTIDQLWRSLTSISSVLIILYMIFWALLGYEIGKEFGLGGKVLLGKTFYITLVPNLILMALVVFRIVPVEWFQPLLTPSFIIICILCTVLLYPISYASFRWGTKQSI